MVNTNKLRGKIAECGYTQAQVAKGIGMGEVTFSRRMKSGKFSLDEADKMIDLLNIENPMEIFFSERGGDQD